MNIDKFSGSGSKEPIPRSRRTPLRHHAKGTVLGGSCVRSSLDLMYNMISLEGGEPNLRATTLTNKL